MTYMELKHACADFGYTLEVQELFGNVIYNGSCCVSIGATFHIDSGNLVKISVEKFIAGWLNPATIQSGKMIELDEIDYDEKI